jgi:hypothetical protein
MRTPSFCRRVVGAIVLKRASKTRVLGIGIQLRGAAAVRSGGIVRLVPMFAFMRRG